MNAQAASQPYNTVSVVIPTTLRPELARAVKSVLSQSLGRDRIEVIIAVDAQVTSSDLVNCKDDLGLIETDQVVSTGGGCGGGAARRLGTQLASGDWIAYLDDDDEWLSDKLEHQVNAAIALGENARNCIISTRVRQRTVEGSTSIVVPKIALAPGQKVEEYLFRKRLPSIGRATIYTSTLLTSSDLARRVQWRTDLRRHQDWDWILRVTDTGAPIVQLKEPLVTIWTGSSGSISASSDWESSLKWALEIGAGWSPKVLSDFLAAQTLRYAMQARSAAGFRKTIAAIANTRYIPSFSCILIGFGGLVNRKALEALLVRSGGHASRSKSENGDRMSRVH